MRGKRRRGIWPVGTIVLIWVFFAFILPVLRLSGGLIAAGLDLARDFFARGVDLGAAELVRGIR